MHLIDNTVLKKKDQSLALFSEQGLINKHECWAESVELFFENPAGLQQHYPELYGGIMALLQQDPIKKKVASRMERSRES